MSTSWAVDPLFSLPVVALGLASLGVLVYRGVIRRVLHAPMLSQILCTFGLVVLLRGLAQFFWTPNYRMIGNPLVTGRVEVAGIFLSVPQLAGAVGALAACGFLFWLVNRTKVGWALQATAEDRQAVSLMGIDTNRMFALAWAIGLGSVGVAGGLLANFYYIFPEVGAPFGLIALVAVAFGGFGSITGALIAGVAALVAYPFVFRRPFPQHLMIMVGMYALLGCAWNILGGYAGQVSLGHSVYFGVGAYGSSLLLIKVGLSPWLGMLGGALAAMAVSVIIGYPTFRLKGRYFAIATLAVVQIAYTVMVNWQYAGGAVGLFLPIVRGDRLAAFQFHTSKTPYYFIIMGMLALVLATTRLIEKSYLGYYLRGIREDPDGAEAVGIDTAKYKMVAMCVSTFFTAVAGTFYAQYVLFIDPDSTFLLSVLIVLVAVMGGVGSLWGPVLGAAVLIPLSEFTRVYLSGYGKALDLVMYGVLIVVITVYQPRRMVGLVENLRKRGRSA